MPIRKTAKVFEVDGKTFRRSLKTLGKVYISLLKKYVTPRLKIPRWELFVPTGARGQEVIKTQQFLIDNEDNFWPFFSPDLKYGALWRARHAKSPTKISGFSSL